MKYVIKSQQTVKPFTRTRKGKMERVKQFTRRGNVNLAKEPIGEPMLGEAKAKTFNYDKMKRLMESDRFLKKVFDGMNGSEEHKAEIVFNTYVVGDSVMERRYNKAKDKEKRKRKYHPGSTPAKLTEQKNEIIGLAKQYGFKVEDLSYDTTKHDPGFEKKADIYSTELWISVLEVYTPPSYGLDIVNKMKGLIDKAREFGWEKTTRKAHDSIYSKGLYRHSIQQPGRYSIRLEHHIVVPVEEEIQTGRFGVLKALQTQEDFIKGRGPDKKPRKKRGTKYGEAWEVIAGYPGEPFSTGEKVKVWKGEHEGKTGEVVSTDGIDVKIKHGEGDITVPKHRVVSTGENMKKSQEQVKPFTRTRKGKMERVKGFSRVRDIASYPKAVQEATAHQIGKDYLVSKKKAREYLEDNPQKKKIVRWKGAEATKLGKLRMKAFSKPKYGERKAKKVDDSKEINWVKAPSVTYGGKDYFFTSETSKGRVWVVWDRSNKMWKIDIEKVRKDDLSPDFPLFKTPEEGKKFAEQWVKYKLGDPIKVSKVGKKKPKEEEYVDKDELIDKDELGVYEVPNKDSIYEAKDRINKLGDMDDTIINDSAVSQMRDELNKLEIHDDWQLKDYKRMVEFSEAQLKEAKEKGYNSVNEYWQKEMPETDTARTSMVKKGLKLMSIDDAFNLKKSRVQFDFGTESPDIEKAVQVKGFTRTRKGKMERVKPYSREQAIRQLKSKKMLRAVALEYNKAAKAEKLYGKDMAAEMKEMHTQDAKDLSRVHMLWMKKDYDGAFNLATDMDTAARDKIPAGVWKDIAANTSGEPFSIKDKEQQRQASDNWEGRLSGQIGIMKDKLRDNKPVSSKELNDLIQEAEDWREFKTKTTIGEPIERPKTFGKVKTIKGINIKEEFGLDPTKISFKDHDVVATSNKDGMKYNILNIGGGDYQAMRYLAQDHPGLEVAHHLLKPPISNMADYKRLIGSGKLRGAESTHLLVQAPYSDKIKLHALRYIQNTKNPHEKSYAYSYFQFILDGETGSPPEDINISHEKRQVIKQRLNKIFSSDVKEPIGEPVEFFSDSPLETVDYSQNRSRTSVELGKQIAKTILLQMGGAGKIKMMTGANNFMALPSGVSFDFPNKGGPNHVKITLEPNDTYTVEFGRKAGEKALMSGNLKAEDFYKQISKHTDIYFDQLKELFEEQTGLYLSFNKSVTSGEKYVVSLEKSKGPWKKGKKFPLNSATYDEFTEKIGKNAEKNALALWTLEQREKPLKGKIVSRVEPDEWLARVGTEKEGKIEKSKGGFRMARGGSMGKEEKASEKKEQDETGEKTQAQERLSGYAKRRKEDMGPPKNADTDEGGDSEEMAI